MTIKQLIPSSPSDCKWYDDFIQQHGQDKMDKWIRYVYEGMDKLQQVGDSMIIANWCPDEHLPVFIPIAWCYMQESKDRDILFSSDYKKIILYFDASEMEKTSALLQRKHKPENPGADGTGTERGTEIAETLSAPVQGGSSA